MPVPQSTVELIEKATLLGAGVVTRLSSLASIIEARADGLQKLVADVKSTCSIIDRVKDELIAHWDTIGFNDVFSDDVGKLVKHVHGTLALLNGDLDLTDQLMGDKSLIRGVVSLNAAEQVQWRFLQAKMRDQRVHLEDSKTNMDLILMTISLARSVVAANSLSSTTDSNPPANEMAQLTTAILALRREATLLDRKGERRRTRVQSTIMDTAIPAKVVNHPGSETYIRTASDSSTVTRMRPHTGTRLNSTSSSVYARPTRESVRSMKPVHAPEYAKLFHSDSLIPVHDNRGSVAVRLPPKALLSPNSKATNRPETRRTPTDALNELDARTLNPSKYQPHSQAKNQTQRQGSRTCFSQICSALQRKDPVARRKPSLYDSDLKIDFSRLQAWTFVANHSQSPSPTIDAEILPLSLMPVEIHDLLAQRGQYHTSILRELNMLNSHQRHMVLSHVQDHNLKLLSVYCDHQKRLSTILGPVQVQTLIWITSRTKGQRIRNVETEKDKSTLPDSYSPPSPHLTTIDRLVPRPDSAAPNRASLAPTHPRSSTTRAPSSHPSQDSQHLTKTYPSYQSWREENLTNPLPTAIPSSLPRPPSAVHFSRPLPQPEVSHAGSVYPSPPSRQSSTSSPIAPPPWSHRRQSPLIPSIAEEDPALSASRTHTALVSAPHPHREEQRRAPSVSPLLHASQARSASPPLLSPLSARGPEDTHGSVVFSPTIVSPASERGQMDQEQQSDGEEAIAELLGRWTKVLEADDGEGKWMRVLAADEREGKLMRVLEADNEEGKLTGSWRVW